MAINFFISSSYSGATGSTGSRSPHPVVSSTEGRTMRGIQPLFRLTLPVRAFNGAEASRTQDNALRIPVKALLQRSARQQRPSVKRKAMAKVETECSCNNGWVCEDHPNQWWRLIVWGGGGALYKYAVRQRCRFYF